MSVASFHRTYLLIALAGLLTAIIALALGRIRARDVAELPARPVLAPAPAE
jgi:hypothetical protein